MRASVDDVVEGRHVVDVDAAQHGRLAQVGRHDLGEGKERLPIGLDATLVHEDVAARRDEHRVDDEVGEQTLAGERGDPSHGRRLGEHAGLDGAHVEVVDDRADLGFDDVGIEVRDRAHAEGVLCGDGGEGRRGEDAKGVQGADVGLNSRATAGVRTSDT